MTPIVEWVLACALAAAVLLVAWFLERRDARRLGVDPANRGWRRELRQLRIRQAVAKRELRRRHGGDRTD